MSENRQDNLELGSASQNVVSVFRGDPNYDDVDSAIRKVLEGLGFNGRCPLGTLIQPGDCVVLKPNLIREAHLTRPNEWEQVITHGKVIRGVARLVADALQGRGKIIIADGPQTDSDFDEICRRTDLRQIQNSLRNEGMDCDVLDLRRDRWFQKGEVIHRRIELPGDPAGYTTVDLGEGSEFSSYRLNGHFYGADYDTKETARFHADGHHSYVLCRTVMNANVLINLPKLKTHKKTGVTLSLKNLVGINGYRNCLPHFTIGTSDDRGDEFPLGDARTKFQSSAISLFKRVLVLSGRNGGHVARFVKRVGRITFGDTNTVVRSGNWYGNDTVWRMVLDLNKALFYFGGDGRRREKPLRYLTIIDGIVAGGGNGPMTPDAVPAGLVVAGLNPVAVDSASAMLMGFDDAKVPMLAGAWRITDFPLARFPRSAVHCVSNVRAWNGRLEQLEEAPHLAMTPHFGWIGHIERAVRAEAMQS